MPPLPWVAGLGSVGRGCNIAARSVAMGAVAMAAVDVVDVETMERGGVPMEDLVLLQPLVEGAPLAGVLRVASAQKPLRLASLDVFRGLSIAVLTYRFLGPDLVSLDSTLSPVPVILSFVFIENAFVRVGASCGAVRMS